jgi:hypothetical protein
VYQLHRLICLVKSKTDNRVTVQNGLASHVNENECPMLVVQVERDNKALHLEYRLDSVLFTKGDAPPFDVLVATVTVSWEEKAVETMRLTPQLQRLGVDQCHVIIHDSIAQPPRQNRLRACGQISKSP